MPGDAIVMNGLLRCEFFDMESSVVGDVFRIFVAQPAVKEGSKYPVIYVLDGNANFPIALGIHRSLVWGAEAPAAFIVGIGYPTETGYAEATAKRNRDYAPTEGGEYARAILGAPMAAGGSAFLRFLLEELQPELIARYPIDMENATLVGCSLAGLFGAWTLLTAPATFQRYILASPLISWNTEEVWRWEEDFAQSHRDLSATVFLSAGGLETAAAARANVVRILEGNPKLRTRYEKNIAWFDERGWPRSDELPPELANKLKSRNYPSLRIHCQNMPEETHASVPAAVISRGLRYVFGHWNPSP